MHVLLHHTGGRPMKGFQAVATAMSCFIVLSNLVVAVALVFGFHAAVQSSAAIVLLCGSMSLVAVTSVLWYTNSFWRWLGLTPNDRRTATARSALRILTGCFVAAIAALRLLPSYGGERVALSMSLESESLLLVMIALSALASTWVAAVGLFGSRVLRARPPDWSTDSTGSTV